jgi:hypothetical protein
VGSALLGRHLSIILEHVQMNEQAADTLRTALAVVVPGDPTLHCRLAQFEERGPALKRLQLALELLGEDPDDWTVPHLRETIEREIQLRK